jgi:ABC-type lipoprotein release transport system permease subunit
MRNLDVIVQLALRNLRRHMRRTLLTAAAIVIGGGLMMFSLTLGDGTHESWIDSGVRMGSGHITVEHPEFRVSRKIDDRLSGEAREAAEEALGEARIREIVTGVSPRVVTYGLASSPAGARPVRIVAADPLLEADFSTLDDQTLTGRYLEAGDRLAAYVGSGLVEALDLEIGSRCVLTAQDVDGEIVGQLVRIVGVFRSGVPEVDQSLIHIPLETAAEWLGSGNDVTNIAVLVRDSDSVAEVTEQLRDSLADLIARGTISVMSWREAMPELNAAVAIDDFGNYLIYGILFIIIGFSIVNTVLMSVLHRNREFGVLQALGFTPGQTGALILAEGIVLTGISSVVGIGLGIFVTWYFWGDGLDFSSLMNEDITFSGVILDPVIIPRFRVARVVQALAFTLTIGGAASIYPALRAAKIDVTEAMKFER